VIVIEKKQCVGCAACYNACPVHAIEMQMDEEGFRYPLVNESVCIKCGRCNERCPAICEQDFKFGTAYAIQHKNQDVLMNSTSGGLFTAISDVILTNGGIVYGAAYSDNLEVKHIRAEDRSGRDRMRGSKYIQSDMGRIYAEISEDLQAQRPVLFVGTPCQVHAVKKYFKAYNSSLLFTCDLVCHGVPSPRVFQDHLVFLSRKYRSKVVKYNCRPKRWGWHVHQEIATLENGREIFGTAWSDVWRELYYRRVITRPSCYECKYSRLERVGDISIADCRHIENTCLDINTYNGVSLAIVNSLKGEEMLESIRESCMIEEVDIQKIIQPPLSAPSGPSENRDAFWNTYTTDGYRKAIDQEFGKRYSIKYRIKKLLGR